MTFPAAHHRRLVLRDAAPRVDLAALLARLADEFEKRDATELRADGGEVRFRVTPLHRSWGWRTLAPMSGGRVAARADGDDVVIDMRTDFARQTVALGVLLGFFLVAMVHLVAPVGTMAVLLAGWTALFTLQRCLVVARFGRLVERVADETIFGEIVTMSARRDHRARIAR